MSKQLKTAVFLTGAAAQISQEIAIIDQLIAQKNLTISQEDTLLAGLSSGALNLVAINACFCKNSNYTWDTDFKKDLLFNIKTSDIYTINHLPFDTSPLRKTLAKFLKSIQFQKFGDLPFHTSILIYSLKYSETFWFNSNNHASTDLLDSLMASTAIPVIFPHQKIQNHIGDFIDGGRKGVFDEFETNFGLISKNNGQFDDLHIISPMRKYVKFDYSITKSKIEKNNLMVIAEIIRMRLFITFLKDLHKFNSELRLAKNIYVSIPNLNERFPLITFDYQKEQYDKVFAWFTTNPNELAIPLEAFLKSVK